MSFSLGQLSTYTEQVSADLLRRAILEGTFTSMVRVEPGIKSSKNINILESFLTAAAGACGYSPAGSTVLSAVTVSVCDLQVAETLCPRTLEDYWLQTKMKPGQYPTNVPFEETIATEKAEKLRALIEDIAIRGNVALGAGNLALCNGLLQVVDNTAVSARTAFNMAATAFTQANAVALIDAAIGYLPADVQALDDLTLFVSYPSYRTILNAYRTANLFNFQNGSDLTDITKGTIHPGSVNVKVVPLRGLTNSATVNRFFLTPASNIVFGTDLLNDAENFKMWYSQDNDEVRFKSNWSQGIQVIFPEFFVRG